MDQTSTEILFDKFEILDCLKKDSHTSVYIANHVYLGIKIVLKTLNTDDLSDKTILERFKREAKILARLDHQNLIKVLDFGTHSHYFYISFEYFDSRNLREVIKNNNLSSEDKNRLVIQLLKALNIAHQNQVIHRDIKPENILVNNKLELKIADFGLALIQDDHALTQKSSIVGTPSYMSPEQIRGETLTPQSDLFSTGIVCYELFTGKNPLLGNDLSETINKILNFDDSKLEDIQKIPDQTANVIKSMLKKNKSQRIKSASDGLNILGVNATVYNLVAEREVSFGQKLHYLYYAIPVLLILLFAVWLFSQSLKSVDITPVQQLSSSQDSTNNPADTQQQISFNENQKTPAAADTEPKKTNESVSSIPGILKIDVHPWAYVEIDGKELGATPLKEAISLPPGRYSIKLMHRDFPVYTRRIRIRAGSEENIKINFNELIGFLQCRIEPWGDVYINNVHKGMTPLQPIKLLPGEYLLTVTNPDFGRREQTIRISEKETTVFELNFKSPRD